MTTIEDSLREIYGNKVDLYASSSDNFEQLVDRTIDIDDECLYTFLYKDKFPLSDVPAYITPKGEVLVSFETLQVLEHHKTLVEWNHINAGDVRVFSDAYDEYYVGITDTTRLDDSEDTEEADRLTQLSISQIASYNQVDNVYKDKDGVWYGDLVFYLEGVRGCMYNTVLEREHDNAPLRISLNVLACSMLFRDMLMRHVVDLKNSQDLNVMYDYVNQLMKSKNLEEKYTKRIDKLK